MTHTNSVAKAGETNSLLCDMYGVSGVGRTLSARLSSYTIIATVPNILHNIKDAHARCATLSIGLMRGCIAWQ